VITVAEAWVSWGNLNGSATMIMGGARMRLQVDVNATRPGRTRREVAAPAPNSATLCR